MPRPAALGLPGVARQRAIARRGGLARDVAQFDAAAPSGTLHGQQVDAVRACRAARERGRAHATGVRVTIGGRAAIGGRDAIGDRRRRGAERTLLVGGRRLDRLLGGCLDGRDGVALEGSDGVALEGRDGVARPAAGRARIGRFRTGRAVVERAERRADVDVGALRRQDFDERAVGERGQLDHGLVALDLDDRLAALEALARLLQPAGDASGLHRLAKARQGQGLDAHANILATVSATSALVGMLRHSSVGETGIGMSSPAMRSTGSSR